MMRLKILNLLMKKTILRKKKNRYFLVYHLNLSKENEFFSPKFFFTEDFEENLNTENEINFLNDSEINIFSSSDSESETEDFPEDYFKDFKKINKPLTIQKDEDNDYDKSFFNTSYQFGDLKETFKEMNLSRELLRSIDEINFITPTMIQKRSIPILLQGLDVCGSAVTGSGKTAAFLLPTLERLLHRNRKNKCIRVVVLLPTRELSKQCYDVCFQFCKYTDIKVGLIIGGESMLKQKRMIKQKPEVIVCTPGRLISHLLNTSNFNLNSVEILILDEADRLLDLGFEDEIKQIIKFLPKDRQSILFSATMTDNVEELTKLSLNYPVRISCNPHKDVPITLVQEFIKIRSFPNSPEKKERKYRESVLISICCRVFKKRVIIFSNRKVDAKRLKFIFLLFRKKASLLHGDLQLQERLEELDKFKSGKTDYLITTDLASRGLDFIDVNAVINFYMPYDVKTYVHRVGRTARIGKNGIAVSLIDESSRGLLKQIVKRARKKNEVIRNRVVNSDSLNYYREKIEKINPKVNKLLKMNTLNVEISKTQNLLNSVENFEDLDEDEKMDVEIDVFGAQRGKKLKWFQTKEEETVTKKREKEKRKISKSGLKRNRDLLEKVLKKPKKKRRKLSEDDNKLKKFKKSRNNKSNFQNKFRRKKKPKKKLKKK